MIIVKNHLVDLGDVECSGAMTVFAVALYHSSLQPSHHLSLYHSLSRPWQHQVAWPHPSVVGLSCHQQEIL